MASIHAANSPVRGPGIESTLTPGGALERGNIHSRRADFDPLSQRPGMTDGI
jgi:hypothetical protein